jgi:hypothetical protein
MIPKLLKLIWECIRHGFKAYDLKNLWIFLWKGYTQDDYTDLDIYLTTQISKMVPDLVAYKISIAGFADADIKQLHLAELACWLTLDAKDIHMSQARKEKVRDEFMELLQDQYWDLWV